jgi:hypothetical protein
MRPKPQPLANHPRPVAVAVLAVALVATACSGGGTVEPTPSPSGPTPSAIPAPFQPLLAGAQRVDLISTQSAIPQGSSVFTFGLVTADGALLSGGSPKVYAAPDGGSQAVGPFEATSYTFAPHPDDQSPKSPLTAFYAATIDLPAAGTWTLAAVADLSGAKVGGVSGQATVAAPGQVPNAVGSKAISVKTPVATTEAGLKEIDTRIPPSHMHYISLDEALKNGKPTVVVFATPLLCESMLCGPVVDEVLDVFNKVGADKANFIHVEEFLPGPDLTPPPAAAENQSPGFKAWGLLTEPWTFVIDGKGIIRARFEGPVTSALVEQALDPLL